MITRRDLLKSREFWLTKIQMSLYSEIENYLKTNDLNKSQFAKKIGVSKSYVSQVLNGDFDHKLSKLIDLSLAIGKVPVVNFENLEKCILMDELDSLDYLEKSRFVELDFDQYAVFNHRENATRLKAEKDTFGSRVYKFSKLYTTELDDIKEVQSLNLTEFNSETELQM